MKLFCRKKNDIWLTDTENPHISPTEHGNSLETATKTGTVDVDPSNRLRWRWSNPGPESQCSVAVEKTPFHKAPLTLIHTHQVLQSDPIARHRWRWIHSLIPSSDVDVFDIQNGSWPLFAYHSGSAVDVYFTFPKAPQSMLASGSSDPKSTVDVVYIRPRHRRRCSQYPKGTVVADFVRRTVLDFCFKFFFIADSIDEIQVALERMCLPIIRFYQKLLGGLIQEHWGRMKWPIPFKLSCVVSLLTEC